jgi:hypothetical protein
MIDVRVMNGTGVNPPDYIESRAAFLPVVQALQARGWRFKAWVNESTAADLADGNRFRMRRRFVVRIKRSAEHQARAEAAGEVKPGEDTYEQVVTQVGERAIGQSEKETEDDANPLPLNNALRCLASLAIHSIRWRERPADRLRDLEEEE